MLLPLPTHSAKFPLVTINNSTDTGTFSVSSTTDGDIGSDDFNIELQLRSGDAKLIVTGTGRTSVGGNDGPFTLEYPIVLHAFQRACLTAGTPSKSHYLVLALVVQPKCHTRRLCTPLFRIRELPLNDDVYSFWLEHGGHLAILCNSRFDGRRFYSEKLSLGKTSYQDTGSARSQNEQWPCNPSGSLPSTISINLDLSGPLGDFTTVADFPKTDGDDGTISRNAALAAANFQISCCIKLNRARPANGRFIKINACIQPAAMTALTTIQISSLDSYSIAVLIFGYWAQVFSFPELAAVVG